MSLTSKEAYSVMFCEYPDVVDVEGMSHMLRISTKTCYQLLKSNTIRHFKIGRQYKIPKINIIDYLNPSTPIIA